MSIPFLRQKDMPVIDRLSADVKELFAPSVMNAGKEIFLREEVNFFLLNENWHAQAIVGGKTRHLVRMALRPLTIEDSHCGCGASQVCEHMAAMLLYCYKSYGLSMKQLMPENTTASVPNTGSAASPKPRGSALADMSAESPQETDSPEMWQRFFEKKTERLGIASPEFLRTYRQSYETRLMPYSKGWKPLRQTLYQLHVYFFLLKRLDESFETVRNKFLTYSFQDGYERAVDGVIGTIIDLTCQASGTELDAQAAKAQAADFSWLFASYAFPKQLGIVNWMFIYRMLWEQLLIKLPIAEDEIRRLHDVIQDSSPSLYRDRDSASPLRRVRRA